MEETPEGTPVGVDDPYAHAGVCDYCTGEGTCRFAFEHPETDLEFARERRTEEFACPVAADAGPDWGWVDCPHFRSRSTDRACQRLWWACPDLGRPPLGRPVNQAYALHPTSELVGFRAASAVRSSSESKKRLLRAA